MNESITDKLNHRYRILSKLNTIDTTHYDNIIKFFKETECFPPQVADAYKEIEEEHNIKS